MTTLIIHHDYDLSYANTMALASRATLAIEIHHLDDITPAISHAKTQNLPILVLSGGSNVLLPSHLDACVLLPKLTGIKVLSENEQTVMIEVAGGEHWHSFIQTCLNRGWYGLENLALIPGMVGACPIQNIGAYGIQVSDFIDKIIAYDLQDGNEKHFDNAKCQFDYRHSYFKQHPNRYFITAVVFTLHKDPEHTHTNYGDLETLAKQFAHKHHRTLPHPQDVFEAVVAIRQSKLPDPKVLPNCGSFFQNPIISMPEFLALKARFDDLPSYPINDTAIKVPAGWLIDKAGLKGNGIAPILTHNKQALVLTNHAPLLATQADIEHTQTFIIQTIQDIFGINLVREPIWINTDGSIRET